MQKFRAETTFEEKLGIYFSKLNKVTLIKKQKKIFFGIFAIKLFLTRRYLIHCHGLKM